MDCRLRGLRPIVFPAWAGVDLVTLDIAAELLGIPRVGGGRPRAGG